MDHEPCYLLRTPNDVLLMILHSLGSINTLISFSSTCRQLRLLFELFPRQICTSVTNNRLGLYASSEPMNACKSCFPFRTPPEHADSNELRKFVVQDSLRIERLLTFIERTAIWLTDAPSVRFDWNDPPTLSEVANFRKLRQIQLLKNTHHKSAFCALINYYHASLSRGIEDYIGPPFPPEIIEPRETVCYTLVTQQIRTVLTQLNILVRDKYEIWPEFEHRYMKAILKSEIKIGLNTGYVTLGRKKCPHTERITRYKDSSDIFTRNARPM